ncbi:MAG TPA: DUF2207 domain-containing protein [Candidatus Acidoferrales bacterium]|nr:DUF2207 domain-containing protein [Candidatus Acidoferrales bacterium]
MSSLRRAAVSIPIFILLTLVAASLGAFPAHARQLTLKSFDEQVVVHPDSTIDVAETLEVQFQGSWNGIYRTIPVEYRDSLGLNYTLFIDPQSVTDEDGHPLKYEVGRQGQYKRFKIYVPGAVNTTKTIVIRYKVLDALRFFPDHDELYWSVTGNEWEMAIENATARIELPSGVTGLHAEAFTGGYGQRGQEADVRVTGNIVQIRMQRPLFFHEGLTAVVGWDNGFVHPPSALAKVVLFLRSNWPFSIPVLAFFIMGWLWYSKGRDPRRNPITVQYEPPEGMSPGEVGTLVDNEADMRDITATIVDLAVRGFLTIQQTETSQMLGMVHHKNYIFHRTKAPTDWTNLKPHEQVLLSAFFDGGGSDSVSLTDLQNHFYTHLPAIRNRIFDGLMSDGFYLHRPDKLRQGFIGAGIVIGFGLFFAANFLSAAMGISPVTTIAAGILTGLIVAGFGYFMSARTVAGERALEKVLGFEDFLGHVEKDRIERIEKTPEMFEKFLPYAMALRVEKKWAGAFQDIYRQPPSWYSGPYGTGFAPYLFVNDLNAMSMQAGSAMASSPRSAGGSGFGGGGFSGGGFGGGGGGGF